MIICTHLKWFKTTAPSIDMKQFWLSGSLGDLECWQFDYNRGGDADNYSHYRGENNPTKSLKQIRFK